MENKSFQEIERKFLVKGDFKALACHSFPIMQGYICSVPERTVRVRLCENRAFLTIKGKAVNNGLKRFEWEKRIALKDARKLIQLCEPGVIEKRRYWVEIEGHRWEVDEFYGENEGLVLAEIELETEEEHFVKPDWVGEEVTGDKRYYNSFLSKCPYCNWNKTK